VCRGEAARSRDGALRPQAAVHETPAETEPLASWLHPHPLEFPHLTLEEPHTCRTHDLALGILEGGHLLLAQRKHALVAGVAGCGELAADVEELVLKLAEDLVQLAVGLAALELLGIEDTGEADDRVELVDGAVGLDPGVSPWERAAP
jgi:hypothetical protein